MAAEDPKEFYKRLKDQLIETTDWPSDYLYKFIVPTKIETIEKIENIFNNMGAVLESKRSKGGKYTSISVTVNLKNPDEVIEKYKEVGTIEGVISL